MERVNINDWKLLPAGVWLVMFGGGNVWFQGKKLEVEMMSVWSGGELKKVRVGKWLFIEQNPHKSSKEAFLVREKGYKILWVIDRKKNRYVGKVVNGVFSRTEYGGKKWSVFASD